MCLTDLREVVKSSVTPSCAEQTSLCESYGDGKRMQQQKVRISLHQTSKKNSEERLHIQSHQTNNCQAISLQFKFQEWRKEFLHPAVKKKAPLLTTAMETDITPLASSCNLIQIHSDLKAAAIAPEETERV